MRVGGGSLGQHAGSPMATKQPRPPYRKFGRKHGDPRPHVLKVISIFLVSGHGTKPFCTVWSSVKGQRLTLGEHQLR